MPTLANPGILLRAPTPPLLNNAENAVIKLFCISPIPSSARICLVEETNNLSSDVLATGLLVVHDAGRGGKDDVAELTGGQQLDNPLLELGETDVVSGGDDTGLVEATVELDDDLA